MTSEVVPGAIVSSDQSCQVQVVRMMTSELVVELTFAIDRARPYDQFIDQMCLGRIRKPAI
nr:hypothetical protein Iba_chr11bCG15990 [Ipomoea batatas]